MYLQISKHLSPVEDVTLSYFGCNNPGTTVDPQLTATVTAGSNVTAFWESWPHNIGPIMVYMAVSSNQVNP